MKRWLRQTILMRTKLPTTSFDNHFTSVEMETPPSSWTQHRQAVSSSNQQRGVHGRTTHQQSKKLGEGASGASPEIENSSDESDHEREEIEQVADDDESREVLVRRCNQLQEDVEVLASHLESQERTHTLERGQAEKEKYALQQENEALRHELSGLRIEGDALRRQNAQLATQQAEGERQANAARETHEEMILALTQQQKEYELLQSSIVCAARDRAEARKALDRAQMHCRRLEEELSSAHTQVLHLQNERNTLQAALNATATGVAGYEARQLRLQDEVIAGLRADLVQMEFEMKTLAIDKAALVEQVDKLQQRLSSSDRSADYDVVPLGNNSTRDLLAKRKGQKKRTTIRPVKSTRDETARRGSDLFNNLMELPNAVTEPPESASATIWLSPSAATSYFTSSSNISQQSDHEHRGFRIAPPGLASFVAKTVQSARKHLASPLQTTFSSPQ